MQFLRYAWSACPTSGSLLYLAIFARKRCLVQWQISRPRPGCPEGKPTTGIWQQVAEVPPLLNAVSMGRCTVPGTVTEGSCSQQFQKTLESGRLLIELIDPI